MGINVLAVTDHNASGNVGAVQRAAAGTPLTVLPGMELQTREEVHLLCLFDRLEQLDLWQALVDERMPPAENDVELFGEQFLVDEVGEFIRRESQLLVTSASISLKEAVERILGLGGLPIPAHVNRQSFSLITNLGLVPSNIPVEVLEISGSISPSAARRKFPQIEDFPLVQDGDVHRLDDFLGVNVFNLAVPTIDELRLAFRGTAGRSLHIRPL